MGLALGRRLLQLFPDSHLVILEKEAEVAQHASGRNSGVLHAGFYYPTDSLKAYLCKTGNQAMKAYCRERQLPLNPCGKLVVTRSEAEIPALRQLFERGQANGVPLLWLKEEEVRDIDPNARTHGYALFSPETATVNPQAVCLSLKQELLAAGAEILLDTRYLFQRQGRVYTSRGMFEPGLVFNAAGLYADKIAQDFGFGHNYTLLPFKGIYLGSTGDTGVIQTHIYPVPDPRQPFLGVHFTKTVTGAVKIGPTAIPAFWRENYQGFKGFQLHEMAEILWYESRLFLTNAFGFRELALSEMRKYIRQHFVALAAELVHHMDPDQFKHALPPGIRAQLFDKEKLELVQDFVITGDERSVHILNAVSPAFTCALTFADYICRHWLPQKKQTGQGEILPCP